MPKPYLMGLIDAKKITQRIVQAKDLEQILTTFNAQPEDRFEISEQGAGNYIHNIIEKKKEI